MGFLDQALLSGSSNLFLYSWFSFPSLLDILATSIKASVFSGPSIHLLVITILPSYLVLIGIATVNTIWISVMNVPVQLVEALPDTSREQSDVGAESAESSGTSHCRRYDEYDINFT